MKKINKKQLTLIELIIVIVVLGILVGLAAPRFTGVVRDARHANFLNDVDVLSSVALMIEAQRDQDAPVYGHDGAGTELAVTAGSDLESALVSSFGLDLTANPTALTDMDIMPLDATKYAENMGKSVKTGELADYYVVTAGEFAGTIVFDGSDAVAAEQNVGVMDGNDVEYFGLEIKIKK